MKLEELYDPNDPVDSQISSLISRMKDNCAFIDKIIELVEKYEHDQIKLKEECIKLGINFDE